MIKESEICDCENTAGSSERNEKGFITHGLLLGGCDLIRRSVVFWCGMCESLSASVLVDYVRHDNNHIYYCDGCQELYGLSAVDCSIKRCHNWPK